MWLRLSLEMGIPFRELQARISSDEFAYYMAFDSISPIGEERADLRAALGAWSTHQAAGGEGEMKDFMLNFKKNKTSEIDKRKAAETGLDFLMARQNAAIESGK